MSDTTPPRSPSAGAPPQPEAVEAYLIFLERLRSGEDLDFEAYRARRPAISEDLARLQDRYVAIAELVRVSAGKASVSARLRKRYGELADPRVELKNSVSGTASGEAIERLEQRRGAYTRYALKGEMARGGMGAILRVWDQDLRRELAMKVVLGKSAPSGTPAEDAPPPQRVARFVEEAQVTGQLDHPGIVPVHELGVDDHGGVYFTMRLVQGRELRRIFELVQAEEQGWNTTRALGVLLRVCEAVAYAHERGVLHRDLKPANVMVGKFGETYVMDWGLARVMGSEETKDIRIRATAEPHESGRIDTDRDLEHRTPDSPLVTMDGDVVGTPAYMPLEQAKGKIEELGPSTDVYAIGSMLYQLLAGSAPYSDRLETPLPIAVLRELLDGPPTPLVKLAPKSPPELIAITERAMEREPSDRYPDMLALADDLRAYLENRVVSAHRTGPWTEFTKWVERNSGTAAALGALLLVVVGSGFALWAREQARSRERERFHLEQSAIALPLEAERLWPISPELVPEIEEWIQRAERVLSLEPNLRSELEELARQGIVQEASAPAVGSRFHRDLRLLRSTRARRESMEDQAAKAREQLQLEPSPWRESGRDPEQELAVLEEVIANLEQRASTLTASLPDTPEILLENRRDSERAKRISELLEEIARLSARPGGELARMRSRLELARTLRERTVEDEREAWEAARERVARDPRFEGVDLAPQLGLVPIGPDPASGLEEFWHVASGERPRRSAAGDLELGQRTGIVLVLIPGGSFLMGAQSDDEDAPNHDPRVPAVRPWDAEDPESEPRHPSEGPVHEVTLDAYLLSKYEMTQGQWLRLTGSEPSEFPAGNRYRDQARLGFDQPLDGISWIDAETVLARYGLDLPTEARWEHGARAGSSTPYFFGEAEGAPGKVNVMDLTASDAEIDRESVDDLEDGYYVAAPVDALAPNAFGLHHVHGNVSELVKDRFWGSYDLYDPELGPGGEHVVEYARRRSTRGGSWLNTLDDCRASKRMPIDPATSLQDVGVRPARSVTSP